MNHANGSIEVGRLKHCSAVN